ncbi:hypothetical protein GF407_12330 [candidate division KSB1 bacterium]|nr:hypothetical protein [candidate division KSB1 bacterium]
MLVRVNVERVTLDTATSRFVVILKDDAKSRWLPIVVGSTEAQAIALQLENIVPPRPLTHDLIKNLLFDLDVNVDRIVVNDLKENTYYALVTLILNGEKREIDARPSDAIALALRMQADIFVEDDVMNRAAIMDQIDEKLDESDDDEELAVSDQLEQLNVELRKAVQDERYEEAARIRDEIKRLKADLREKLG